MGRTSSASASGAAYDARQNAKAEAAFWTYDVPTLESLYELCAGQLRTEAMERWAEAQRGLQANIEYCQRVRARIADLKKKETNGPART